MVYFSNHIILIRLVCPPIDQPLTAEKPEAERDHRIPHIQVPMWILPAFILVASICNCAFALNIEPKKSAHSQHHHALPPIQRVTCDTDSSRRRALAAAFSIISAPIRSLPLPAFAAPPMSAGEADNVGARFERSVRKRPPKILRNKLNLDFAVLLMRSSYNALDELDCVAMDQFQRDFFLIRQAEYQPYVDALGPGAVKQGELTDPYYFDFISFAQYATINREVIDPNTVFEEQQPVEVGEGEPQQFVPTVIKRTVDAKLLPTKHSEMVGNKILDRLNEIFAKTEAAIPVMQPGSRPDSGTVLKVLKQLVVLFVINGFAFDGKVLISKEGSHLESGAGTEFTVTFTSPATLWSGQALQLRKTKISNDFLLKTAYALLSRAGYDISNANVKYTGNQEITTFTIV